MRISITFLSLFLLVIVEVNSQRRDPNQDVANRGNISLPTLRIASIISNPFLIERENADGKLVGNERFEGFIKDLLDEIANLASFNYRIILPDDQMYGRLDNATGRWSGLVGMVQEDKADVIAADLTLKSDRLLVLDFSQPFLTAPLTILTRRTQIGSSPSSYAFDFFAPFSIEVWLLFFLAFILTSFTFWLVARISPCEQWPRIYPAAFNLPNSAWFLFSCFFRGSNYTPKALSTRFLSAGWWIFTLVMLIVYCITLKGFMSSGIGSNSNAKTVEQLLEDPDFRFAVLKEGASHHLLKNSQSPQHREIYSRIEANPAQSLLSNVSEGTQLLMSEDDRGNNLGIIMEGSGFIAAKNCQLYTVGNLADRQYPFGFKRGSPYRVIFSQSLLHMTDNGQLHMLRNRWWHMDDDANRCPDIEAHSSSENGVTKSIENMMCPFIFLAIMLLLALILALLELIYDVYKSKTSEKKGDILTRRIREAFCSCCKKASPIPESRQTQT